MANEYHLGYEITIMAGAALRYREEWHDTHATPNLGEDAVYFLESCLLHVRNLLEFLVKGDTNTQDATHYGVPRDVEDAEKEIEEELGETAGRIYRDLSRYLVHLDKRRQDGVELFVHEPVAIAQQLVEMTDTRMGSRIDDLGLRDVVEDARAKLAAASGAAGSS